MESDALDNKAPHLKHPPIVEAVLDIDCDMPPDMDLASLRAEAQAALQSAYPEPGELHLQEQQLEQRIEPHGAGSMNFSSRSRLQALQFRTTDKRQIIQFRQDGFSFNRLAPYSGLDDYMPEIERVWHIFVQIARPVQTRTIRLRYINRILLPFTEEMVNLDDYLRLGPQVPGGDRLSLAGFLYQYAAEDKEVGSQAQVLLASQKSEGDYLPVIFDITGSKNLSTSPGHWAEITECIGSLRGLKNLIFEKTLTDQCLRLFNLD